MIWLPNYTTTSRAARRWPTAGKPSARRRGGSGECGHERAWETTTTVGAAGVLVTAAGYQDVAAVYPNLSIYYYWNPRGHVVAR